MRVSVKFFRCTCDSMFSIIWELLVMDVKFRILFSICWILIFFLVWGILRVVKFGGLG